MKILKWMGGAMLLLGMIGLLGSIIVPNSLASKAQLIQRMTPYDPDMAALTGEAGTAIGEPQLMIIEDKDAFMGADGEGGAKLVNDSYLKEKNLYPLQLKTVHFVGGIARLATGIAFAVGLALFVWADRRLKETTGKLQPLG